MSAICKNPRCADWTSRDRWLCPSCRLAAGGGLAGGAVLAAIGHALGSLPWLAIARAVLDGIGR